MDVESVRDILQGEYWQQHKVMFKDMFGVAWDKGAQEGDFGIVKIKPAGDETGAASAARKAKKLVFCSALNKSDTSSCKIAK